MVNKSKEKVYVNNNPISDMFADFTDEQKMSMVNLLFIVSNCDFKEKNTDTSKEIVYLDRYIKILGVDAEKFRINVDNRNVFNLDKICKDLSKLSLTQKEFLVFVTWGMVECDGKPNDTEINTTIGTFGRIGIEEFQFVSILQKFKALGDLL